MLDKKAQQILFNTYWSSCGWKSEPTTKIADLNYAINAGYMFNPIELTHDEVVNQVISNVKKININRVREAFLSSLSSRRLDWRSALGSYAIARNFPKHKFTGEFYCTICGVISESKRVEDLSVLNFERLKWGGVRHLSPIYIKFDLDQFSKADTTKPTKKDFEIFNGVIESVKKLNADARPRDLENSISKILKSNKSEREVLIQILGYCGILQSQNHKGFFESFINFNQREDRSVNKIDWDYPVSWWRGIDGVNESSLNYFFPFYKDF